MKSVRDQNSPEELRQWCFTLKFAAEEAPVLHCLDIKSARYRLPLAAIYEMDVVDFASISRVPGVFCRRRRREQLARCGGRHGTRPLHAGDDLRGYELGRGAALACRGKAA